MDDSRAKKFNTKKIALVIACAVMVLISIPFGLILALNEIRFNIAELYEKDITLAEDIVLDDEETLSKYGEPVKIFKGTVLTISDWVTYWGDSAGYEYMHSRFTLPDGEQVTFYIAIDSEYLDSKPDGPIYQLSDVSSPSSMIRDHADGSHIPPIVIDIHKLESYQTIREEYLNSREKYVSEVRNCKIIYIAVSFIVAAVLSLVVLLICKKTHKESIITVLLPFIIFIDIAIIVIAFDKYLWFISAV